MRFHQRKIGMDRVFQHMVHAIDFAGFLALREQGAIAGGGENRAQPGARRLNTRGQVALRHQFQFDCAAAPCGIEMMRIRLARERADDFAHAAFTDQRGHPAFAVSGVVVDDRQVADSARDQGVDQPIGHAGGAEPADHHRRAVANVRHRRCGTGHAFVDHRNLPLRAVMSIRAGLHVNR